MHSSLSYVYFKFQIETLPNNKKKKRVYRGPEESKFETGQDHKQGPRSETGSFTWIQLWAQILTSILDTCQGPGPGPGFDPF